MAARHLAQNPGSNAVKVPGTQAIGRALAVLNEFREARVDLAIVQIAENLGLAVSTAHRIVRVLMSEGYLAQSDDNERYYLGTGAMLLGQAAQRNLGFDLVRQMLHTLRDETGESVNLGIIDRERAMVVERVESPQQLRFSQPVGTRILLHVSSIGKSLLAFSADLETQLSNLSPVLVQLTPNTHTSLASLRADLAEIRLRGWSTDDEESVLGVRCVGAPITDASGHARAAIAVQAPAVRMPESRFAELGPQVAVVAKQISELLPPGHRF